MNDKEIKKQLKKLKKIHDEIEKEIKEAQQFPDGFLEKRITI